MAHWLLTLVVILVTLKLLVWWLEPRMAFFPIAGVQETPAAFGQSFADVRIPTGDGETLHAWWLEHPNPRAQVIFWHGNGGNLSLWLDVIAGLRQRDFSVLAVDYRGYGGSSGRPSERGLLLDADASVRHFNAHLRKPDRPVVFWGRSLGVVAAARGTQAARPDAVVLESPFPDVASVFRGNPVMTFFSWFSSYKFATSRLMDRYDGPLLVVHGDRDTLIPFRAGREVFERSRSPKKEFVAIRGAEHNDLHIADAAAYWAAIDRFMEKLGTQNQEF